MCERASKRERERDRESERVCLYVCVEGVRLCVNEKSASPASFTCLPSKRPKIILIMCQSDATGAGEDSGMGRQGSQPGSSQGYGVQMGLQMERAGHEVVAIASS